MLTNCEKYLYTRATELRRLKSNDVHRLAEILGLDGGRKLMEIIPKHWHAKDENKIQSGTFYEQPRRYSSEQIRVIEDAAKNNCGRYFAEILIQEWGTHGRRHERPTIGLLLELLIAADLWHAAEFVAEQLLREAAPARPLEGPAARFCISIPLEILKSVADFADDNVNFPNTSELNDNDDYSAGLYNHDYYMKQHCVKKCLEDILTLAAAASAQQQLQFKPLGNMQYDSGNLTEIKQAQQQQVSSLEIDSVTSPKIPSLGGLLVFSSDSNSNSNNYEQSSHTLSTTTVIPMLTLLGTNIDKSDATVQLQK